MSIPTKQSFTRDHPCPVCTGWDGKARGKGERCYGYLDSTAAYARCTREEHAGLIALNSDGTYSHRLAGPCRCGVEHGPADERQDEEVRHVIRGADGTPLAVHARKGTGQGKRVWWEQADGTRGLNGAHPVDLLYGLEQLAGLDADTPVMLTEGEKAADAIARLGYIALGTVTGSGDLTPNMISMAAAVYLAGREVFLFPDNDDRGRAHMAANGEQLSAVGAQVQVMDWPEAPEKGDAADLLAALGVERGRTRMAELVAAAVPLGGDVTQMVAAVEAATGPFIDWHAAFSEERPDVEWIGDALARGRGHSIWARGGSGKSEWAQWASLDGLRAGHVVLYLDYEMMRDDVVDRMMDFGCVPEDLDRLKYALIPDLPPLDTPGGAAALGALVDGVQGQYPDRHVVVVIDTIGRAVEGAENDNDTILRFYRHSGYVLKVRGVTWARLDHTGHEGEHARGGSAKSDDVDIVWHHEQTEGGCRLVAGKRRSTWVPEKVEYERREEPHLTYVAVPVSYPLGTPDAAALLDQLGVPLDASNRAARKALVEADEKCRNAVLFAALRWRRGHVAGAGSTSGSTPSQKAGSTSGSASQKAHPDGKGAPRGAVGSTLREGLGSKGAPPKGSTRPPSSPDWRTDLTPEQVREAEGKAARGA